MKELLYENKLEAYYKELDIDIKVFKKQRFIYMLVFFLLGSAVAVALTMFMGKQMMLLGIFLAPLAGFIGWKYMYFQLKQESKRNKRKLDLLFPEFLTTFISLLNSQANGNLIFAIENTIPYMKEPIKSQLVLLVRRVYTDSSTENAYFAFNEFSKAIDNKESDQILSLLLDMYIAGINKDTLGELESRIEKMKQNQISAYAKWKNNRLKNKASFPSIGIAVFFIFFWIAIVASHYLKTGMSGANLG